MKLAFISSSQYKPIQRRRGFHMALAQYLLRDLAYYTMYKELHEAGCFIIVDNGEAEGTRVDPQELVKVATAIGADEIVVPDTLKNPYATLQAALTQQSANTIPACKRLLVPQGTTWEEWENCLDEMVALVDFATIGVAKHLEKLPDGRAHALKYIREKDYTAHNIHLLGCYGNPLKEIRTANKFRFVRSIDTGAPLALAQNGIVIDGTYDKEEHHSLQHWLPADYEVVVQNLKTLDEVANGYL